MGEWLPVDMSNIVNYPDRLSFISIRLKYNWRIPTVFALVPLMAYAVAVAHTAIQEERLYQEAEARLRMLNYEYENYQKTCSEVITQDLPREELQHRHSVCEYLEQMKDYTAEQYRRDTELSNEKNRKLRARREFLSEWFHPSLLWLSLATLLLFLLLPVRNK